VFEQGGTVESVVERETADPDRRIERWGHGLPVGWARDT
jgi:hypothetical protein